MYGNFNVPLKKIRMRGRRNYGIMFQLDSSEYKTQSFRNSTVKSEIKQCREYKYSNLLNKLRERSFCEDQMNPKLT